MLEIWWIAGAAFFGAVIGFLTGASEAKGTAKSIAVAMLGNGAITALLAVVKDTDSAGQFLFSFSGGFVGGLVVGLRYRKTPTTPRPPLEAEVR